MEIIRSRRGRSRTLYMIPRSFLFTLDKHPLTQNHACNLYKGVKVIASHSREHLCYEKMILYPDNHLACVIVFWSHVQPIYRF